MKYKCSSCRNFSTDDRDEFMEHRDTCDGPYTRDIDWFALIFGAFFI